MKLLIYIFIILFAKVTLAQDSYNVKKEIYTITEEMLEFLGGTSQMMKFIAINSIYPLAMKERSIGGRVYLKSVVNELGEIKDAKILKGIEGCPASNTEALRVLNLMPNWKPAFKEGKPIDFKINLPMYITLK